MSKQDKNDQSDFLDETVAAARSEGPTDREWEDARRRLHERLNEQRRRSLASWLRQLIVTLATRPRVRVVGLSLSAAAAVVLVAVPIVLSLMQSASVYAAPLSTPGELRIMGPEGEDLGRCPLRHTDVEADIAGYVARVTVRQSFHNPTDEKIEAVYVFPLPEGSAVDRMTMVVGDKRIVGQVHPKPEARQIYEAAKQAGKVASLLDQERPNIFTQSVANIEPGAEVQIEIGFVDTLKYEDGIFEFVFPMVVAPRYVPGQTYAMKTDENNEVAFQLVDFAKPVTQIDPINPPVFLPHNRSGHDISMIVSIDGGMEIHDLASELHEIDIMQEEPTRAMVTLKELTEIPNRDFILRYSTATDRIGDACLVHEDERGRFFTLVLQPPRSVAPEGAVPKEMIFVIDRSGSMGGFPIEKAKETMKLCIEQMNPKDTFNLLSFSGGTGRCFESPQPNTPANREQALQYLKDLHGSGGTQMMPAILEALGGEHQPDRVRIVCFMTDGQIGNDFAIIDAVQKNVATSRVFTFGIGNSTNRFLLEAMAHEGRGEVQFVSLNGEADQAAKTFHERIHKPVLTDISIDWGTLAVEEVYPENYPDLFSVRPLMIHGRLTGPPTGTITLRGMTADGPFEDHIVVAPTEAARRNPALASLWARSKVDDLMHRDLRALQNKQFPDHLREAIVRVGVDYQIMTQFTSFVAVDESRVTEGDAAKRVDVPAINHGGSRFCAGISVQYIHHTV